MKTEFPAYAYEGANDHEGVFLLFSSMRALEKEMKKIGAVFYFKWYETPFFNALREKYHGGYIWSRPVKIKKTGEIIATVRARRKPLKRNKK